LGGDAPFHILGVESLVEHKKKPEKRVRLSGFLGPGSSPMARHS
jgi:hypothetical protein